MNDRGTADVSRERGFALLFVLWTMVLLSLLATGIAAVGRTEALLAGNLRDAAVAEAAADGAVHDAIFRLLGAGGRRSPAGRHRVGLPDATVEVSVEDLSGRVNPNTASPGLMRALLRELGVDARRAASLVDAILDWRTPGRTARPNGAKAPEYRAAGRDDGPPGAPFRHLDELGAVLGMTPELLALLRPHLTLWWDDDPDPAAAGPVVLAALRATGGDQASNGGGRPGMMLAVAVTAEAIGPHGSRFVRRATMEIIPSARGGGSWRLLDWSAADPTEP